MEAITEVKESEEKEVIKQGDMVWVSMMVESGKTKDLGHGVLDVVISSPRVDYHGESINQDGINIKEYHGTVLYGHDYQSLPIGKALKVWRDKETQSLRGRIQLAVAELPFADTVYKLIKGGYLTDVSIGGIVDKMNDDYTVIEKMTMKEFSIVPIGANHDAQIVAMSIGKSVDQVKVEYSEALRKSIGDKFQDKNEQTIKEYIISLKEIIAALEGETGDISKATATEQRVKLKLALRSAKKADEASENLIKVIKIKLRGEN